MSFLLVQKEFQSVTTQKLGQATTQRDQHHLPCLIVKDGFIWQEHQWFIFRSLKAADEDIVSKTS